MKIENQKIAAQCWADISARGPALWPGPVAQPAHASRHYACVLGAVTAWWPRARQHGQRGFTGGLSVAQPAGSPRGSDGGCTRQGGAVGFSPEMAGGGGA
jgi:hypothetical protein